MEEAGTSTRDRLSLQTIRSTVRKGKSSSAGNRQAEGERGAFARGALDLQARLMGVQNVLDDGQAEPGAALLPRTRAVHAVEPLGQPGNVLRRNANAFVHH